MKVRPNPLSSQEESPLLTHSSNYWLQWCSAPWPKIRSPPCSLSIRMPSADTHRPMQVRRCSQRWASARSGAEANQTSPHYFHRGAAGRTGGAVPAEPVSRCEHKGETSTAHTLKRRKSGGKTTVSHSAFVLPDTELDLGSNCSCVVPALADGACHHVEKHLTIIKDVCKFKYLIWYDSTGFNYMPVLIMLSSAVLLVYLNVNTQCAQLSTVCNETIKWQLNNTIFFFLLIGLV